MTHSTISRRTPWLWTAALALSLGGCSADASAPVDARSGEQPLDVPSSDETSQAPSDEPGSCAHAEATQAGPYSEHLLGLLDQWEAQGGMLEITLGLETPEPPTPFDANADEASKQQWIDARRAQYQPLREPILEAVRCAGGFQRSDSWSTNQIDVTLPAARIREVVQHPNVENWSGNSGSGGPT